jgi:ATP synthase protein I
MGWTNARAVPRGNIGAAMEAPLSTRPIRRVLRWQAGTTVAVAVIAGLWLGGHAALSGVLGGVVNITAVVVYAVVLGIANPASAGGTVMALFRAEACKILVIIAQLCLVLLVYKNLVPAAFFASFVITVLLFRMALVEPN